jgi:hypothetical protein
VRLDDEDERSCRRVARTTAIHASNAL